MAAWRGAMGLHSSYVGLPTSMEKDVSYNEDFTPEKCTAAFLLDPAVVFQVLAVTWCWISYVLSAPFSYFQLLPVSAAGALSAARVYSLKPLQAELSYFKEENAKFRNHNEQLSEVAESLQSKNRALERSICDLEHVREALERYAEKTHGDVGAVLAEVKSSIVEQERSIAEQKRIQKKTQIIQRRQRGTLDLLLQSSLMSLKHSGAGGVADKDFNELYAMLPASLSATLVADGGARSPDSVRGGQGQNLPDMLRETMTRLREMDADEAAEEEAEAAIERASAPGTPGWQQTPEGLLQREGSRISDGTQDAGGGPGALRRMRSGTHMQSMGGLFGPVRGRSAEPPEQSQDSPPQQGPFGLLGTYRLPVRARSRERRVMEAAPGEEHGRGEVTEHPGVVVPPRGSAGCAQQAREQCAPGAQSTSARSLRTPGGAHLAGPDRQSSNDDPPTARVAYDDDPPTARDGRDGAPRVTPSTGSLGRATGSRSAAAAPALRRLSEDYPVPGDDPLTARSQPHDQVAPLLPSWGSAPGAARQGASFVTFADREESVQNDEPPTHRSSASSAGTIYSPVSSGRGPLQQRPTSHAHASHPGAGGAGHEVSFKMLSSGSTTTPGGQWTPSAVGLGGRSGFAPRDLSYN